MIDRDLAFPLLGFDKIGDFRVFDSVEDFGRLARHEVKGGGWVDGLIVDASGKACRIEAVEAVRDPSESWWTRTLGIGRSWDVPVAVRLGPVESISPDTLKQKVRYALETYWEVLDDGAFEGGADPSITVSDRLDQLELAETIDGVFSIASGASAELR